MGARGVDACLAVLLVCGWCWGGCGLHAWGWEGGWGDAACPGVLASVLVL